MAIRRYRIQDVSAGMVLALPALNTAGRVVLSEGTVLTEKLIDRLQNWHIYAVDVWLDEGYDTLPVEETILPAASLFAEKPVAESQKKFFSAYETTIREVEAAFAQIRYFKVVPMGKMRELADRSFREFSLVPGAANLLYMLEGMDDRMVRHSLNVAVIAGILGRWLGFSAQMLQEVVLSALLHDVGKLQLPEELVQKKLSKLSAAEMKIFQTHTIEGYNLLNRPSYRLPFGVLAGVLQHHEWADGTGYPLHLADQKIHLYAQVILVADMYESMTTKEMREQGMTPFAAVEIMIRQMFEKLSPVVAGTFLKNIRENFIGNIVRLNDGREAIVVYLGRFVFQRPVVYTKEGEFIDLEQAKHLSITAVLRV